MIFAQYYLECLSQASYLVGDETTGRAVVVDPRRDVGEYVADAAAHGLTIVGVIDTHFHADFLAGHLELAERTGAWIGFGDEARPEFPARLLADGERIELGDVVLEVLAPPGHTPESISVLVWEHAGDAVPHSVLTGDTLFVGDVGRPDLLASIGVTADELGRRLHASVARLMELPDAVRVLPGHGAGSACGKNLSTERASTIGDQRRDNPACRSTDVEDFLAMVTAGQPAAPGYFVYDAFANRRGHELFDPARHARPLAAAEVDDLARRGAVLLDARDADAFAAGHLPGSLSVPLDGRFAETVGTVVDPDRDVVVVAPQDREEEVVTRLARIGADRVLGYLRDPDAVLAEPGRTQRSERVDAAALAEMLAGPDRPEVLDVRNRGELAAGAVPGARRIPLAELPRRLDEVARDRTVVVHCAGGYRSGVAASLLRRAGFADVRDLAGGYAAWAALPEERRRRVDVAAHLHHELAVAVDWHPDLPARR